MTKIRLHPRLAYEIGLRVYAEMATSEDSNRDEIRIAVLAEFAQRGDAERYIRRDGKIGWRASSSLLEQLREMEADNDFD